MQQSVPPIGVVEAGTQNTAMPQAPNINTPQITEQALLADDMPKMSAEDSSTINWMLILTVGVIVTTAFFAIQYYRQSNATLKKLEERQKEVEEQLSSLGE